MNARERVRAALTCRAPDRIPKALAFWEETRPEVRVGSTSDYFKLDVRFAEFRPPSDQQDFLRYLGSLPQDVHVGSLAQLRTYHRWNYHPEVLARVREQPTPTVDDLAALISSGAIAPMSYEGLAGQIRDWHAQGLAVAGSPPHLGGELFEMAYRLRGFQEFLVDLKQRGPFAAYLLDQLTALMLQAALILAEAGVDILLLDDDVAMPTGLMIGPGLWRAYFKPRLADVIRQARAAAPDLLVFYHSDGNFTRLVPDLVEIGVNVIHPVQPDCMDARAIKQAFGDRLALWGTVGTAALWDAGSPDAIRAEVKLRIETLGPGGLLLAPAYDVDFAPFCNLEAFFAAVDEFGRIA